MRQSEVDFVLIILLILLIILIPQTSESGLQLQIIAVIVISSLRFIFTIEDETDNNNIVVDWCGNCNGDGAKRSNGTNNGR